MHKQLSYRQELYSSHHRNAMLVMILWYRHRNQNIFRISQHISVFRLATMPGLITKSNSFYFVSSEHILNIEVCSLPLFCEPYLYMIVIYDHPGVQFWTRWSANPPVMGFLISNLSYLTNKSWNFDIDG